MTPDELMDTNNAGSDAGDGERLRTAPLFVVPGAGATTSQGLGSGAGTSTGSPIIPPLYATDALRDNGENGSLANRVERVLEDDGRFSSLVPTLVITTEDNGHVTLGGRLDDSLLRSSLLATVHAVPGVAGVTDKMQ